ncbi:MAG: FIST C-terminal domain-containing protein [Candidatus Poribacteria bacterium]|nr:FIST C-terminal domain-containing protein [Candidatus Poribacteria bacterium]
MIHVGVGHSQSLSTTEAAERATRLAMGNAGIAKADLAIVFATINYQAEYHELYQAVQANSSCDELIGCSGMSVLTSAGEFEGEPAIAVMVIRAEELSAISFAAQGTESEISAQIQEHIQPEIGDDALLVIFPDIRAINPAELVSHIGSDGAALPIVGAAVSGDATGAQMYHWKGEQATERGVTGVLLTGNLTTEIGVAQGCQPIGKPREVTKAEGRIIFELDGEPALENFKGTLQLLTQDDIRKSGGTVFVGIAMDAENRNPTRGDFLIRNLVGINEEHAAIAVSEEVTEGQLVQFHLRNPAAAAEEIRVIIAQLAEKTQSQPPAFGLYFNCLGRGKGLYGAANHDISVIQDKFPGLPIIGFFGNSEFAPIGGRNFAHAYTGVFVLCSAVR